MALVTPCALTYVKKCSKQWFIISQKNLARVFTFLQLISKCVFAKENMKKFKEMVKNLIKN